MKVRKIVEIVHAKTGDVRRTFEIGDPIIAQAEASTDYFTRVVDSNTHSLPLGYRWREAKGDTIHTKLKRAIYKPTRRYLWVPSDEIKFVPALSDRIYGDGRALIHLSAIMSRPSFYVIRVDSSWTIAMDNNAPDGAPEFVQFIDNIEDGLEEQFGRGDPDEDDEDPDVRENGWPWPAYKSGGCQWGRVEWPKLRSVKFEPNPMTWCGNLVAR